MPNITTYLHQTSSSSSSPSFPSHISWRPSFFQRRTAPATSTTTSTTASSSTPPAAASSMPLFGRRWLVRRSSIGELCPPPQEPSTIKKPSKSNKSSSKHTRSYKQQKRRQVVMQFLHEEGLHESIKNVWDSTDTTHKTHNAHRTHHRHRGGSCHHVGGGSCELDESTSSYATASTCNFSFSSLEDPSEREEDETESSTGSDCCNNDLLAITTAAYEPIKQGGGVRWHPSVEEELERRRIWLLHNPPKLDPNRFRTRTRQRLDFVVEQEPQPEQYVDELEEEEETSEEFFVDALEEEPAEEKEKSRIVYDDTNDSDSEDDGECVVVGGRYFEI